MGKGRAELPVRWCRGHLPAAAGEVQYPPFLNSNTGLFGPRYCWLSGGNVVDVYALHMTLSHETFPDNSIWGFQLR